MRSSLLVLCLVLLASLVGPVGAQPGVDQPPPIEGQAVSLLPPGNSGFVSVDGQAAGSAGGSYGENSDDQSQTYWGLEGYAGQGFADPADAVRTEELLDGAVRIYWDDLGVPAIYGDTGYDVWYGAGYAIAQIRLFLMDAVRRLGRGTYAALVGAGGVSDDVMQRTLAYSDEEYQAFYDSLSQDSKDAFDGYVDGANDWIAQVNTDPSLLPVEYALLSAQPEPLDVLDALAAGVYITRFVASEGGNEMDNVRLLRDLEAQLGSEAGRGVFTDLVWQDDPLAVTTVPREEGTFPNAGFDAADADAVFEAAADYAATLPLELTDGPGTGAYPDPQSAGFAAADGSSSSAADSSSSDEPDSSSELSELGPQAMAAEALIEWAQSLHGGSIAVALGPGRTADNSAVLLSGPQLGYSYPSLLVELEVHGGGYNARGSSVPSLPTVGIGYTDRVAWALTTGYSKTIDSFIETVRGPAGALEYFHDGEWKAAECREETIPYREAAGGALPVGPALRSETVSVCRTVHGPVVAVQDGEGERLARAVQYQMFGEEVGTVEGILAWNRAKNFEDFEAAMRMVTWNENTTYADADGHIAYWHPGVHRERAPFDLRFPMPGDGSADFGDVLPFEALPHAVDPGQGFLANWNNKPAHEWLDGVGVGNTSRPGGAVQRVSNPIELIGDRTDLSFAAMQDLEVEAGLLDPRATPFLPVILSALEGSDELAPVADLLAGWNRRFYDPPNAPARFNGPGGESSLEDGTDGPAATVFEAVLEALLADVFGDEWDGRIADPDVAATCNSGSSCPDLFSRQLGVGGHRYDMSPGHNLLLRVLDPSSSGLTTSRDYLDGRSVDEVVVAAVESALDTLEAAYESSDLADYRRPTHMSDVSSLTGVTGPSATQPYMDRGSYIHVVGFDSIGTVTPERLAGAERIETALEISRAGFPDGAPTVIVATALDYHDALLAAPLAGVEEAPLLLVGADLRADVAAEVSRLAATNAIIVGSEQSVPPAVAGSLTDLGLTVRRLAGDTPFEVAAAVATDLPAVAEGLPDAFVVSAENFPDAVSVAGVAARTGVPILMVTRDEVPDVAAATLSDLGAESTVIVGGTAVVSDAVEEALPGASRLAGAERYATAEQVLRYAVDLGLEDGTLLLATGENFPDSLTGGALAAATDGLVVLTRGLRPDLPGAAFRYAEGRRVNVEEVFALGGTAVIDEDLLAGVR